MTKRKDRAKNKDAHGLLLKGMEELQKIVKNGSREAAIKKAQEVQQLGFAADKEYRTVLFKFNEIKKRNADLEKKIADMQAELDVVSDNMTRGDYRFLMDRCAKENPVFWSSMDTASQDFFVVAVFLRNLVAAHDEIDWSPIIIEFCRVFENELKIKIFEGFINTMCSQKKSCEDNIGDNDSKLDAAIKMNISKEHYFLSIEDMLNCLREMSHLNDLLKERYCYYLREYIIDNRMDADSLGNSSFVDPAKNYNNNFRNKAAHPNYMDEDQSIKCEEQTKKLLGDFIQYSVRH